MRWMARASVIAVLVGTAPLAFADEREEGPVLEVGRLALIPAQRRIVERVIEEPARTRRICSPIYEYVTVPIMRRKVTPRYDEVEVPVYAWRYVPEYRAVTKPMWGEKLDPVYVDVKQPVGVPLWNPFCRSCTQIPLYEKCEKVQVAWISTPELKGHRTDQFPGKIRRERYVARTETKRVCVGEDVELVEVGARTARRLKGFETEIVEVHPARTLVVEDVIHEPARCVTVVPDGITDAEPLPGTEEVLTETEYEARLSAR